MSSKIGFNYGELKWPESREVVKEDRVVMLPTGSIEQHGPHLPLEVDSAICYEICRRTAERIPDKVLLMPPVIYGYNANVMDFPGTMAIEDVTFLRYVRDIVVGLAHHGFKRVLIVNGHGGNTNYVAAAACQATIAGEGKVLCAAVGYWDVAPFVQAVKRISDSGPPGKGQSGIIHAGEFETSMYLAMKPELVDMDKATDWLGVPNIPDSFKNKVVGLSRPPNRSVISMASYWSSISPNGIVGTATRATKEKGEQLLEAAAEGLAEIITDLRNYPMLERVDHH